MARPAPCPRRLRGARLRARLFTTFPGRAKMSDLESIARAMVATGKGILAADESSPTIKKRFDSIEVESSEENRRAYRELLFQTQGRSVKLPGGR